MRIRIRGPSGSSTITFAEWDTVRDLKKAITEKTSLTQFEIKYSYPPKPLVLPGDSSLLSELDVKLDGEQLTISDNSPPRTSPRTSPRPVEKKQSSELQRQFEDAINALGGMDGMGGMGGMGDIEKTSNGSRVPNDFGFANNYWKNERDDTKQAPEIEMPDRKGALVVRIMPDDNSCLFRALSYAALPGQDAVVELRDIVASEVEAKPDIFTTVVLEKEPEAYCKWIKDMDSWGGAIELQILSTFFNIEVCSIDVETGRVDKFNEGAPKRCIVIYSGIHYDTVVFTPYSELQLTGKFKDPEHDQTQWDGDDELVLVKALELVEVLRKRHYFTNTKKMGVKCGDCGWTGVGEMQAAIHASETGHHEKWEEISI